MKQYLTLGIICLSAVCLVQADQVIDARGLPYQGAVMGYENHSLQFRSTTLGRDATYALDQLRTLKIDGFEAFNQAETLAAKKKYKEAAAAYDKALLAVPAGREWMKQLLTDRRYQACAKAGRIDEAMIVWLAMMDADPKDKIVLALMPETFAPEGDPANATALKLLDDKLAQLQGDAKSADYTRRLMKLKMKLLEAMGEEEQSAAAAEAISQLDAPKSAKKDDESTAEAPEDGASEAGVPEDVASDDEDDSSDAAPAGGDLEVLAKLLDAGKYDDVIEKLAPRLETLPRNDLAGPLFLLAKAQWLKYQAEDPKDQKLLLRAGLNLMWVYSAYGNSDEAPEALYLTSEALTAMNDPEAARRVLEELIEQFSGAEDNPWVNKAQEQLDNAGEKEKPE